MEGMDKHRGSVGFPIPENNECLEHQNFSRMTKASFGLLFRKAPNPLFMYVLSWDRRSSNYLFSWAFSVQDAEGDAWAAGTGRSVQGCHQMKLSFPAAFPEQAGPPTSQESRPGLVVTFLKALDMETRGPKATHHAGTLILHRPTNKSCL